MRDRTLLLCGLAIGGSFAATRSKRATDVDRRVGEVLAQPLGRAADVAVAAGTDLGSVFAITGVSTALAISGRRRAAVDVAGAGLVAWTAAQGIKPLVGRPRPYQADGADRLVAEPAGSSWPSGHPAVAAAMATALAPSLPPGARSVAAAGAGFVALSRVYVGVHYVTDVVAGLAIGVLSSRAWRSLGRAVRGPRDGLSVLS